MSAPAPNEPVDRADVSPHRCRKDGRRKTKVRELFERQGVDVAWVLGLRLGLKESTLHNWFARWRQKR